MRKRWILFGVLCLATVIAFGGWRNLSSKFEADNRGYVLATRTQDMPYHLPVAGINVELTQYEDVRAELEQIADLNFVWVRQTFLWSEIEPEQGVFNWEVYDPIVAAVDTSGLQLVAVLDGTPTWARHPDAPEHPFAPPASPSQYGEFVRAFAEHYGDQIDYYQIWDEPNIKGHWGNLDPKPALYLAMLDAAYQGIHASDAAAMVIMAALAPNVEDGPDNINDPAYLRAIYELGGQDSFDAAAGKPYGFDSSPDDRTVELGVTNFSRLILLRDVMVEYGDGNKPLWGSHFGWNSLPEDWAFAPSIWGQVARFVQIDYTNRALARAQQEWAWLGGLILQHWEPDAPSDDPIQGFAVKAHDDDWKGVIPEQPTVMTAGKYPAVNPYATYQGDWEFGELGADGQPDNPPNTITIPFRGTEFAVNVRRGDYLAYLLVTIDGEPANLLPRHNNGDAFIALTSEQREPTIDLIKVADGLDADTEHIAVITHRPEQGQDYWSMAGFAVGDASGLADETPVNVALGIFLMCLAATVVTGLRLPFHQIRMPSAATLHNLADLGLGVFFSAVIMVGTVLTMQDTLSAALKRDVPTIIAFIGTSAFIYFAPATWLALIGLAITAVLIFSRPWLGVLLILFWSAFFTTTIDPFVRALYVVDAMLVITCVAVISRLIFDYAQTKPTLKFQHIRLHPIDIGVILLVALGIVSITWSEFTALALRDVRVLIVMPALFYILIRLQKPSQRDLALAVETLLLTGFMLAAIGLLNYFQNEVVVTEEGTKRLLSVYGSPNAVGLMLGRCLPFAFAYVLVPVSQWRKILAIVAGLTMLIAVALSQSVGAILLGIPAAMVVILLGWRGKKVFPLLAGMGAAGSVGLVVLAQFLPRLQQITDFQNNTTVFRVNLWRSTAQLLRDHPLTGVGMDQFLYFYRSRYILPEAWRDPDLSHPHNLLLDYWVRLGILGVLLAIYLQWVFWRQAITVYRKAREHNPLQFALVLGAMGAMADFLAHGLVDMAYFGINLSYVFVFLLVLVVELGNISDQEDEF